MAASGVSTTGAASAGAATLAALVACSGGGGSPAGANAGAIQVATYVVNPQTVECGYSNDPRVGNIASPDTVALRIEMVNTTANDASVTGVAAIGTVLRSSDSADVGKNAMNYASLPCRPQPATIVATTGDVNVIVSLPMYPYCNVKPRFYDGNQDLLVSARLTATSGIYVTTQATMHVSWVPPVRNQ